MWPFKKRKPAVQTIDPRTIRYSQVDVTDKFDDNLSLKPDEWIATLPINAMITDPESVGLPSQDAMPGQVYALAASLSEMRESLPVAGDGVYCPICHIANIDLTRLHTPCPKCGRDLLKFGWT